MNARDSFLVVLWWMVLVVEVTASWGQDVEGGKDPPLLVRVPGFFISEYEAKEFDVYDFYDPEGKPVPIEGKKTVITYSLKEGVKEPSPLQITLHYIHVMQKIGGTFFEDSEHIAYLGYRQGNKEIWAEVYAGGDYYIATLVERVVLEQQVTAEGLFIALSAEGRVALYLSFDTA